MQTTFPKGTAVVYHLFNGEYGHQPKEGIFVDNLTNRRCIIQFKDGVDFVDKDWLIEADNSDNSDKHFRSLTEKDE